jgi:hypothetical protein
MSALNTILDGIAVLGAYKGEIFVFFVVTIGYSYLVTKYLGDEIDTKKRLLMGLGIGSAILSVLIYALITLGYYWPSVLLPGSFLILFLAVLVLLKEFWSGKLRIMFDSQSIFIGLAVFMLLIARLSFIKYIILPSYSDSPIHYQIVTSFLHPEYGKEINLSLGNITSHYYHFGFHSLAAWLTLVSGHEPANIITLLGQLFLVIAPISVFFLSYVITKNSKGALYAGLLAAIGWSMPAFAINWGKFPALSSLAIAPAVVAVLGLLLQSNAKKPIVVFWSLLLLIGITLVHTRIIVCVLLVVVSFFVSKKINMEEELPFFQSVRLSLFYILSLFPFFGMVTSFYNGFFVLVIFLVLLPFAFQVFPKLSVAIFFYTFGLWLVWKVPLLFFGNSQALLDEQFIEIMLYIPFAIIGGAGFAGLLKKLPTTGLLRWFVVAILVGGVAVNFLMNNSMYPDSCCDYFKESDQTAIQWIRENTSEHSLVLISGFQDNGQIIGTDAGIWIHPLIKQDTNMLPFDIKWNSLDEIEETCRSGARNVYVYMGGREFSFIDDQLEQSNLTRLVFQSGKTKIYLITGCKN